uniref:Transposase n=1 Tax=uncultured bacterium Contig19 TaxID=1393523 RepID=W0FLU0_9BACT|nr:transposase [uncultured bacterium Contig19]
MSNHVHLLLRDTAEELSPFMKQLNERYAMRFAKKSGRVGNVFQVPFWSEPIENESYYLSALRYIHANPEAANICLASEYPWSSYGAYTGDSTFVTTEFALELLGGVERFVEFSANGSKYPVAFPKSKLRNHLSADELWHVASKVVGREAILRMRSMKPIERQPYIDQLVSVGFAGYEICRVTGLGRNIVQRAMANHE